jgi:hypothetical protein
MREVSALARHINEVEIVRSRRSEHCHSPKSLARAWQALLANNLLQNWIFYAIELEFR